MGAHSTLREGHSGKEAPWIRYGSRHIHSSAAKSRALCSRRWAAGAGPANSTLLTLGMRDIAALTLLFLCAGLTGCMGHEIEHPGVLSVHALPADTGINVPVQFSGSVGFDDPKERGARPQPRVGDTALYRAHLSTDGETHDWYVQMKLVRANAGQQQLKVTHADGTKETHMSPLWEAAIEVYDCATESSVAATMGIAESSMIYSIFRQAELMLLLVPGSGDLSALSAEQRQSYVLGTGAIANLFNGWQQNEKLQPLMKEVIGFPTRALFGMLLRGSFSYTVAQGFDPDSTTTAVLPEPAGEQTAQRVPISIHMGGVTLMHADLIAVETLGVLGVGFGVTAIRGVHPDNDERWIEIELIGARASTEP